MPYLNFREFPAPDCCRNCKNTSCYMEEGYSSCVKNIGLVISWSRMDYSICDGWEPKPIPTERDKVLAKLSTKDREILGI